jgi:hypothetical protein
MLVSFFVLSYGYAILERRCNPQGQGRDTHESTVKGNEVTGPQATTNAEKPQGETQKDESQPIGRRRNHNKALNGEKHGEKHVCLGQHQPPRR